MPLHTIQFQQGIQDLLGSREKPRALRGDDVNKSLLGTNLGLELLFPEGRLFFASGILSRKQKEKISVISVTQAKRVVKK